jgi:trehalose utilization protein
VNIVVWNENWHETSGDPAVVGHYPDGMHTVIAAALREQLGAGHEVTTATLAEPEHGLSQERIDATDVLLWWGHMKHDEVSDEVVRRVHDAVLAGMGLVVLHSGHYSKIFQRVTGTTNSLGWRNEGERELVWTVAPRHPIAEGVPNPIVIDRQEMYGEPFEIPTPDELIFISSFTGGEVFRSGVTYERGRGRVFYFSPGDQEYPVYHQPEIQRVLANGVRYVAPTLPRELATAPNRPRDWFLN